eukprot:gnl/MRDRNA2_/MRDRNA2_114976_c0_seq1.p1 gnl/MRDRNA2_/MRDRNA2_114976_c0~~gnl/MRDRNA2_/MRDRNA2_114976_c0_seq1.p1  ORF type:complete len:220 (-),score=56.09 gnl/MRDRNA2_/MRDRNA2_114976_c0_seq1:32-691(-)
MGTKELDVGAHIEHVRRLRQNVETPDPGKKRYLELGHTLSTRINGASEAVEQLEESHQKVRIATTEQMTFLKELELQRIDLRRDFQKLSAAHHNWMVQHQQRGLGHQDAIDAKLTEEQQVLEEEIKTLSGHITAVSSNIHRLREVREILEWKIADKKRHIDVDSTVLSARREPLEMPRTLRKTLPNFRDAPGPHGHGDTSGMPWRYLHENWESRMPHSP